MLPTQASMQEEIAVSARWGGGGGDDKDNDGWKDGRMDGQELGSMLNLVKMKKKKKKTIEKNKSSVSGGFEPTPS